MITRKEIEKRYSRICEHIFNQEIKPALDELSEFMKFSAQSDFYYQMETLSDNYRNLLAYAFDGYQDPEQSIFLNNLSASILSIADEIRLSLMEREWPSRIQDRIRLTRDFGEDPLTITTRIEEVFFHHEVNKLIEETELYGESSTDSDRIREKLMDAVFRLFWLTGKFEDAHADLFRKINRSSGIQWHEKCLMVSALTLSLIRFFDPLKLIILMEFAESHENQVYQRALIGTLIGLMIYDRRIPYYPELINKIESLQEAEHIPDDIEFILMQILQARETEKITREFEEEVLPDMKKMMPRIEDKLQLEEIGEEDDPEGYNPKWKGLVDEVPGLLEKIERFSKMQMEGADVFMSTFQLLKRFDFFSSMSHWFVPFYRDHPEINKPETGQHEINLRLIESLEKAFYICNSDKYSFTLNFQAIPTQQRSMIVTNFEAEFAQMKDMASEEQLLDQTLQSNAVFIQYIQDLYRFYKLFPSKMEFDDLFQMNFEFHKLNFHARFFEKKGFKEKLASFYFDKEHYLNAISVYESILAIPPPKGEHYEKIAYCHQKLGRYKKAIENYKTAELFDSDRLWILKKMAWCSMKMKDYSSALDFYKEASTLQPEDLHLSTQIAQCCLNLKDFEQALKFYSKVSFFKPGDMKILRPIAYCHFLMGNLDQAEECYTELLSNLDNPSAYDLMNAGHIQLCSGSRKKALALYRKSMINPSISEENLIAAFDEDVPYLIANGIPAKEIPLIKDYLLFQRNPES